MTNFMHGLLVERNVRILQEPNHQKFESSVHDVFTGVADKSCTLSQAAAGADNVDAWRGMYGFCKCVRQALTDISGTTSYCVSC